MTLRRLRSAPSRANLRLDFARNLDALFIADEPLINGRVLTRPMLPWPRTVSRQGIGTVMRATYTKHPLDVAQVKVTVAGLATVRNVGRFYGRLIADGATWSLTIRNGLITATAFDGANRVVTTTTAVAEGGSFAYVMTLDGVNLTLTTSVSAELSVATAGYNAASDVTLGAVSGQPDTADIDCSTVFQHVFIRQLESWSTAKRRQFIDDPWSMFATERRRSAGAVGFESLSNSGYMGSSADYTFARTVTGENRFLVVDVGVLSAGSNVFSVTDDSGVTNVAATLIATRATGTGSGLIESWGVIAPLAGTKNIRVRLSTAVSTASSAANYTGVHQTVPTEAVTSAVGANITPTDATLNVTPTATGTWIHSALATNDNSVSSADRRDNIADTVGGSVETMDTRGPVPAATAREMRVTGLGGTAVWTMVGFAIRPTYAAAGGGGLTGTITEPASAADTPTAAAQATAAAAESATASDSSSVSLTAIITEPAAATDAPTAAMQATASITEPGAAADTSTAAAAGNYSAGLTEAATATDTAAASLAAAAAITEPGAAADACTAALAADAAALESAAATDTSTGLPSGAFAAGAQEPATAADSAAAVATLAAAAAEPAAASDSAASVLASFASVLETATPIDVSGATWAAGAPPVTPARRQVASNISAAGRPANASTSRRPGNRARN